jgi:hypothetical protein
VSRGDPRRTLGRHDVLAADLVPIAAGTSTTHCSGPSVSAPCSLMILQLQPSGAYAILRSPTFDYPTFDFTPNQGCRDERLGYRSVGGSSLSDVPTSLT